MIRRLFLRAMIRDHLMKLSLPFRLEAEKKTIQKSHMAKTKMMLNNQKELEDSLQKMSEENAELQKQVGFFRVFEC